MKYFVLALFMALNFTILAQINPVNWLYEVQEKEDGSLDLVFTAQMEKDWVIYSQYTDEDGPIPTSFDFDLQDCLVGEVQEQSKAIKGHSDLFMVEVIKFKKESIFVQNLKADCKEKITATIGYMTCDGSRCLPPTEVVFEISL